MNTYKGNTTIIDDDKNNNNDIKTRICHFLPGGSSPYDTDPLKNAVEFKMLKYEIYQHRSCRT